MTKQHELLGVPKHANQHRLSRLTMEVHTDELRILATAVESYTDALIAALERAQQHNKELQTKLDATEAVALALRDDTRVAEKRIAELESSHKKLREAMAGIHNTIRRDGAYTPLAAIMSAAKRAHEESANIVPMAASPLVVKLPESFYPDGDIDCPKVVEVEEVIEAIRAAGVRVEGE